MSPMKIFIVDDNRDFAESLADLLKLDGHQVELAFDGETAIENFRNRHYDITFMDVKLPGLNGVESFFEIRKINPQAKIVMMTGYSVEQLVSQAVENGALGVLTKPIGMPQLLEQLEKIKPDGIILLVDDDREFIDSLDDVLTDHNYRVLAAHTGQEAVDRVLTNNVDVLILDMKLPILNGLEVYLTLKEQNRVIPTIIVTGYPLEEAENINQLRSMSISGCFIKPFDPQDLLDVINLIEIEKH